MDCGTVLPSPDRPALEGESDWQDANPDAHAPTVMQGSLDDEALTQAWRDLEARASLPTQCLAFTRALAATLLATTPIRIFAVFRARRPAALLALCRGKGPLARWRLPGSREVFEPGDALCDDPDAARELAGMLARQSRPLCLDRIPAGSPLVGALAEAMKGRGLVRVRPAMPCPAIDLEPWHADPEGQFSSRRRSDFRRAQRKAEELGEVTYEMLTPPPEHFDRLFDEAAAVEMNSWKCEAGSAIASDSTKEAFHRAFFRAACNAGHFRLAFMRIDGRAVAMQLAVVWSRRFWLFKIGYDEAYAKASPGTLLMRHALVLAAGMSLASFEFLGNVEPWIADLWTRECNPCVTLRTYPYGLRGLAAFVADAFAKVRALGLAIAG